MTKNRLSDLNDHLFMALERLNEDGLSPEIIEAEAKRAAAVVAVADQITQNVRTQLTAAKMVVDHGDRVLGFLPQLSAPAKQVVPK